MKYYAFYKRITGSVFKPTVTGTYEECLEEFNRTSGMCYIVGFKSKEEAFSGRQGRIVKNKD